jgi:hypothetical protein
MTVVVGSGIAAETENQTSVLFPTDAIVLSPRISGCGKNNGESNPSFAQPFLTN